jgi:hypothetical protein
MGLGVLGASRPTPRIDLGPECAPGFPCSEAAENRHELERGLTAFLDRSRSPVDPFTADAATDPLLAQYQDSVQTLAHRDPATAAVLAREAAWIAETSTGARGRRMRLTRSPALSGPYYIVPAPPAIFLDYATTGLPRRIY